MGRLNHAPHEAFARLIAAGKPRYQAYAVAVSRKASARNHRALASMLWRGSGITSLNIQKRVQELMIEQRRSAELTAEELLDDLLLDCDLARAAGQYAASINGRKLIGAELFAMFKDRKEVLNLDVKVTNHAQLRDYLENELGQDLAAEVLNRWAGKSNKLIDAKPDNVIQFPANDTDND